MPKSSEIIGFQLMKHYWSYLAFLARKLLDIFTEFWIENSLDFVYVNVYFFTLSAIRLSNYLNLIQVFSQIGSVNKASLSNKYSNT